LFCGFAYRSEVNDRGPAGLVRGLLSTRRDPAVTDPDTTEGLDHEPPPDLRKIVLVVVLALVPLIALFVYVGVTGSHGS